MVIMESQMRETEPETLAHHETRDSRRRALDKDPEDIESHLYDWQVRRDA